VAISGEVWELDVQSAATVWRSGNDATMKHQGKHEPKKKGKCTKDASKFKRKEVYLEKVGFGRCYDSDIELGVDIIHCILSLESPLLLPPFWIVQSKKRMEEIKEEIEPQPCLGVFGMEP